VTLFEYLAIAFSLVFSFTALRLVSGLPYALDPERRYFVHAFHVFLLLVITPTIFWGFWSFRDGNWNWPLFMSALASPAILYYLACALIPDAPSSVTSWRTHFYRVRRRYFLGFCAWFLVLSVNTTFLLELPVVDPVRATHVLLLAAGIVGAASENPLVQGVIIAVLGAMLIAIGSILLFLPGSLAA
jgi:hypothetical protein